MRNWLKEKRLAAGFTMKEIARELGISESYYCTIENGDRKKNMDMATASNLSALLKISLDEINEYEQQWMREEENSEKEV